MYIYIRTIDNKTITCECNEKDKINIIILKLESTGYVFDNDNYRNAFICYGKFLDLDKTFADYNINDLSFINWFMYKRGMNCPCCGNKETETKKE